MSVPSQYPCARLSASQKQQWRQKWEALTQDIEMAQDGYIDSAKAIACTHHRSLKWATSQLYLGSRISMKRRAANPWNGFLRQKLSEANEHRPAGSKWKLPAFVRENTKELEAEYRLLTREERDSFKSKVNEIRATKKTMRRVKPKAIQKDVESTFEKFSSKFHAVEQRTGWKVFYMAVRGDVEHYNDPKVYMGPETMKFFTEVLNINPSKFAMQYEAFIVGGMANVVSSHKKAINDEISECRTLIAEGLESILKQHDVPTNVKSANKLMNYDNYERRVVENYGVELKGWPCAQFVNPGKLRRADIQLLLMELKTGRCRWVKLSEEELMARIETNHARHEAGEVVYKVRKMVKSSHDRTEGSQGFEIHL